MREGDACCLTCGMVMCACGYSAMRHLRESWRDYRTVYGWFAPLRWVLFEIRLWLNVRGWYWWGHGLTTPKRSRERVRVYMSG